MSLFKVDYERLSSIPNGTSTGASGNGTMLENAFSDVLDINTLTSGESDASYDYMSECYAFLSDYNRSYYDASKQLYKTVLESCDSPEVIHEGFSDFFGKVKEIIKKFLAWIKKIFNKFVAKLNGMFKSESYLKKNKKEFAKFTTSDEFEFEGYTFTNLTDSSDVPHISAINIKDVNSNMAGVLTPSSGQLNYDAIKSAQDSYEDNKEDFFDSFRAKVLGESSDIPQSQFEEECFMKFRDGSKDKSKFTVTSTIVNESYRNFEGYEKLKKAIEKTKNEIDKEYTALERYFEKSYKLSKDSFKITDYSGSHSSYVSNDVGDLGMASGDYQYSNVKTGTGGNRKSVSNAEARAMIDTFLRSRAAQINQMSNIHGIAFSAKLTAAKDCFNQDKAILYRALSKIKGHKAETV